MFLALQLPPSMSLQNGTGTAGGGLQPSALNPFCELFVLVISSHEHQQQRAMIRQTWMQWQMWGNAAGGNAIVRFVVGSSDLTSAQNEALTREFEQHSDLIFLDHVVDSYEHMSKKVLASFEWLLEDNIDCRYVMKTDDNSFVRLDLVLEQIDLMPRQRFYWGYFSNNAQIRTEGKWAETGWDLCDTYLTYALGGGYVVSQDLATWIARNGQKLRLWTNEDVSVGAWLSALDVRRYHDVRFDTSSPNRGCKNSDLIIKKQDPAMMEAKYNRTMTGQPLCEKEYQSDIPGYKLVREVAGTTSWPLGLAA